MHRWGYRPKHNPHAHVVSLLLSGLHSLHHIVTIHTSCTQRVIYLETIINSSLRLNENADRTLQSFAIEGNSSVWNIQGCHVAVHCSRLLGQQQKGGGRPVSRVAAKGNKDAMTKMGRAAKAGVCCTVWVSLIEIVQWSKSGQSLQTNLRLPISKTPVYV